MNEGKPVVSIYCTAYNHERYIRDCLDGLLMQKTDFPYEVIVHDDASTDGTQEIIREYERRYPDIIKPIYQTVNQYQQKIYPVPKFIFPMVRGKYVAICEGDDYWTDCEKLQKQVTLLEEHPECHFCVAGVQEVSLNKTPLGKCHPDFIIHDEIIEPEAFIQYAGKYAFQTSSYLMRYEDWKRYILEPPEFRWASDMGDITLLLYFGSLGKTAYVNKIMSCYRRGAPASFSADRVRWTEERRIKHFRWQINTWKLFDEYSEKKYHSVCAKKLSDLMFGYYILQDQTKELLRKENREYYSFYPLPKKMFILFACVFRKTGKKHYLKTMQNRENQQRLSWETN